MQETPYEKAAVIGRVNPQTVANVEKFTDVIDMSKFHEIVAIAYLGDMANETVTFTAYSCNSSGSGAASISGKVVSLAASATANDNVQEVINIVSSDLIASGKQYCKFGLVTGGGTGGPAAVTVQAVKARFKPGAADDLTSVGTIV
jgi:hypothetical protein